MHAMNEPQSTNELQPQDDGTARRLLRSDALQEVISQRSKFVSYWAVPLLAGFLLLLLAVAGTVKIPRTVKADVILKSIAGPPAPAATARYAAEVLLAPAQLAAIDTNRAVRISLHAYPATEYGFVRARWAGATRGNRTSGMLVLEKAPDAPGGKKIQYREGLKGEATLATAPASLLTLFYRDFMRNIKK